jgi:hypothetical protein
VIDNPFYSHEFHGDYDLVSVGRLAGTRAPIRPGGTSKSGPSTR